MQSTQKLWRVITLPTIKEKYELKPFPQSQLPWFINQKGVSVEFAVCEYQISLSKISNHYAMQYSDNLVAIIQNKRVVGYIAKGILLSYFSCYGETAKPKINRNSLPC